MSHTDDLSLAQRLADLADPVGMRYYRTDTLGTTTKDDGSVVTLADKEIERLLRDALADARPDDQVIGEEYGGDGTAGNGRFWILDPIDGTAHFVHGKDAWSTLIGLVEGGMADGSVTVGLSSAPALGRRWWGVAGEGAWTAETGKEPVALAVSPTPTLAQSSIGMWPVGSRLNESQRPVHEALRSRAVVMRPTAEEGTSLREATGNVHGGLMVAEGLLDAYVLLGGGPWDHAAVVPIVEGAGGRFSDLSGGSRVDTYAGVYTNGRVHDEVLAVIAEAMGA